MGPLFNRQQGDCRVRLRHNFLHDRLVTGLPSVECLTGKLLLLQRRRVVPFIRRVGRSFAVLTNALRTPLRENVLDLVRVFDLLSWHGRELTDAHRTRKLLIRGFEGAFAALKRQGHGFRGAQLSLDLSVVRHCRFLVSDNLPPLDLFTAEEILVRSLRDRVVGVAGLARLRTNRVPWTQGRQTTFLRDRALV